MFIIHAYVCRCFSLAQKSKLQTASPHFPHTTTTRGQKASYPSLSLSLSLTKLSIVSPAGGAHLVDTAASSFILSMDEESALPSIQEVDTSFPSEEGTYFDDEQHQQDEDNKKDHGHHPQAPSAEPELNSDEEELVSPLRDDFVRVPAEKEHRFSPQVDGSSSSFMSPAPVTPVLRQRVNATSSSSDSKRSIPAHGKPMLSETSKLFDRNGKGYLDSTELALRRLDSDNDGKLTIHNVYEIMQSLKESQKLSHELMQTLQKEQKKSVNLKKAVIGLVIFAVLLSLANIGTSFAAARLAKDTEVSSNGDLVRKDSDTRVGVTDKLTGFTLQPIRNEEKRRRLAFDFCGPVNQAFDSQWCSVQATLDYTLAKTIYGKLCPDLTDVQSNLNCPDVNGGLSELHLTCNEVTSTIKGGAELPAKGPTVDYGLTWFPTLLDNSPGQRPLTTFVGSMIVSDPDPEVWFCVQKFHASIVCNITTDDDECLFLADPVAPICTIFNATLDEFFDPDGLLICGQDDTNSTGTS